MHALVFAAGEPPSRELAAALHERADLVVAADSGADRALALGITPDVVVGDLDSLSGAARARIPADRLLEDAIGDRTDLEKAVAFAIDRGATAIEIACAGGGRADHALGNLSVLRTFRGRAQIALIDDLFATRLVGDTERIDAAPGTVISLVALGACAGVTTSGLRWDLSDATLTFGTLGIHNEVAKAPASIRVASGDLVLFEGRWVEHHR